MIIKGVEFHGNLAANGWVLDLRVETWNDGMTGATFWSRRFVFENRTTMFDELVHFLNDPGAFRDANP